VLWNFLCRPLQSYEEHASPCCGMRTLMLADVVVVAITLVITIRFFVKYGRER